MDKAIDAGKVEKTVITSRGARREAMRKAGVLPTSQSLIPDKATKLKDKVFMTRDKKYTIQDARNDISHQEQPHWEAGKVKTDDHGNIQLNRYNRPKLTNPKSKVYYEK